MEQKPFIQQNYKQQNNFQLLNNQNDSFTKALHILFQVLLWLMILLTLINKDFFPLLIIMYILYLIIELTSHTGRFLLNKSSTNFIYNKLKEIFSSAPTFKLSCECYHYEKGIEERKDNNGHIIKVEVTNRITTYRCSEFFPYYSFRDISGLFKIDLNSDVLRNKNYIKLDIDTKIGFADTISCSDYEAFKAHFLDANRYKDEKMDFKEEINIPNLSRTNLIKIKDEEPFYANILIFLICVIFTMGVPFEIMFDNISIDGKFQIHKIISTRYNLNDMSYNNMYGNLIPSIKLGNNEFNFTPNDYGYIDENVEVNLPTLEEIENAKKYENQIKYPVFDDNNNYNNNSNNNLTGEPPAPIYENDLPTEEEVYGYKRKTE